VPLNVEQWKTVALGCGMETEVLGRHVEMVAPFFTAGVLARDAMEAGLTEELADTRDPYPEEYTTRRA
jgi:hypothetical protein